jgi:hypothetical protein
LYVSLPLASANGLQTKAHKALAKIRRLSVILFLPNTFGDNTNKGRAKKDRRRLYPQSRYRTLLSLISNQLITNL